MKTRILNNSLIIFLLLMCSFISTKAAGDDTITVRTFDLTHVYFGDGNKRAITDTFQFPSADVDIKQINMQFTVGCPDGGCDDWDRYGDIDILRPTGKFDSTVAVIDTLLDASGNITSIDTIWNAPFEVLEHFEIMRFITPYGGSFNSAWTWLWKMDVSDYRLFLTDEVILRIFIDTWVNPGWEATIDFEMIEGEPEQEVYKIENLWNFGSIGYGDINNPIETHLTPIDFQVDEAAHGVKVRIINTGHGFGYTDNAAEFSPKTHKVIADGLFKETYDQYLWRNDCADNPLSPQAGTWQYNRANWCPGNEVPPFDYDISHLALPGNTVTVNYDMEFYVNKCSPNNPDCVDGADCQGGTCDGGGGPYYIISSQLMHYTNKAEYAVGAQVLKVENVNGIVCDEVVKPKLVLKNTGEQDITSMQILSTLDGVTEVIAWTGNIKYGRYDKIELPEITLSDSEAHTYTVEVLGLNDGNEEENIDDNVYESTFSYGHHILNLSINTDDFGYETSWEIKPQLDPTTVLHTGNGYASLTEVNETVCLSDGCYKFLMYDASENGMNGAAQNGGTTDGSFSLTDENGDILAETGDIDFGLFDQFTFCLEPLGVANSLTTKHFRVYPNPTDGELYVQVETGEAQTGMVNIFSISGQLIAQQNLKATQKQQVKFDLREEVPGIYMVQVKLSDNTFSERILLTK